MRIDRLITDFQSEKKKQDEQKAKVIIYNPDKSAEVGREPGDERVLFFIPDNGRN